MRQSAALLLLAVLLFTPFLPARAQTDSEDRIAWAESAPGYWVPAPASPPPYYGPAGPYYAGPPPEYYYAPPPPPVYYGPGIYFRFGFHSHR